MNINEIPLVLKTDMLQYRTQVTYQGKTSIRVGDKIGNCFINGTSPSYPTLSLIKKLLRIMQIT